MKTASRARLVKCDDCGGAVSIEAKLCPHCGAIFERSQTPFVLGILGILLVAFFLFGYPLTIDGRILNIGQISDRLCGVLVGLAFCTWAAILSKK